MCKFRTLKASEIDVRVGRVVNTQKFTGASLLLYKNARVDMSILDETIGAMNWQRSHEVINGNLYCKVSIWNDVIGEWVSKSDCGVESNTEKEKGESSDSFKRACVNWGIGRELYSAPQILVNCKVENGKVESGLGWKVKEIEYDADRNISKLVIIETRYGKDGDIVFTFGCEPQKSPTTNETKKTSKSSEKQITLEEAKKATFKNNNGDDILVDSLPNEYLERLIFSQDAKLAYAKKCASIIYEARNK